MAEWAVISPMHLTLPPGLSFVHSARLFHNSKVIHLERSLLAAAHRRLTMTSSGLALGSTELVFLDELPRGEFKVRDCRCLIGCMTAPPPVYCEAVQARNKVCVAADLDHEETRSLRRSDPWSSLCFCSILPPSLLHHFLLHLHQHHHHHQRLNNKCNPSHPPKYLPVGLTNTPKAVRRQKVPKHNWRRISLALV
jgi:hypothetical protein